MSRQEAIVFILRVFRDDDDHPRGWDWRREAQASLLALGVTEVEVQQALDFMWGEPCPWSL